MATKGSHRFIDKVHVRYVEKEKRHWASLENFNSQRIAIGEKFYRDNDRLVEGGIWAEVTLTHNDIEEDNYAFYIEDLRPIQLSRFDFSRYTAGRGEFTRDEWLDAIVDLAEGFDAFVPWAAENRFVDLGIDRLNIERPSKGASSARVRSLSSRALRMN
ncbi:BREX system Lon protease-like protein BrxL [Mesorhizobium sp. M0276]